MFYRPPARSSLSRYGDRGTGIERFIRLSALDQTDIFREFKDDADLFAISIREGFDLVLAGETSSIDVRDVRRYARTIEQVRAEPRGKAIIDGIISYDLQLVRLPLRMHRIGEVKKIVGRLCRMDASYRGRTLLLNALAMIAVDFNLVTE